MEHLACTRRPVQPVIKEINMELKVTAFEEHLTSGREDLVSAEELRSFALTPGASSCFGHGSSSCSTVAALVD
jgi:hypothetical protein